MTIICNPLRILVNLVPEDFSDYPESGLSPLDRWTNRLWGEAKEVQEAGGRDWWAKWPDTIFLHGSQKQLLTLQVVGALCAELDADPEISRRLGGNRHFATRWSQELTGDKSVHEDPDKMLSSVLTDDAGVLVCMRTLDNDYPAIEPAQFHELTGRIVAFIELLDKVEDPSQKPPASAARTMLGSEVLPLLERSLDLGRLVVPPFLAANYQAGLFGNALVLDSTGAGQLAKDLFSIAVDLSIVAVGIRFPELGASLSTMRAINTRSTQAMLPPTSPRS